MLNPIDHERSRAKDRQRLEIHKDTVAKMLYVYWQKRNKQKQDWWDEFNRKINNK